MTPVDEATFIELWQQGLTTDAIAQRLGIKAGMARSRADSLQQAGKIQPRPRGGAYPRQKAQGRSGVESGPSTAHRPPWTLYRLASTLFRRTSPPL
jgi:transposase